ncbi:MAG: response regulator [Myxococcales bacterium]|nr:response regulator [Myxococcales bacterium]
MPRSEPRLRVLAIDDEPWFEDLLVRVLRRQADVTFVTSIDAAAPLVVAGAIDVIVCDLNLPGGGAPAVERLVARSHPDLVPRIVYITGGAYSSDLDAFSSRVSARLVAKPFAPAALTAAVAQAAGAPNPEAERA